MQQPHTWPCFSFHFVHRNIWCDLSNIISSLLIPNISAYSAHFSNGIDKKKLGHSTIKSFFIFASDNFLYLSRNIIICWSLNNWFGGKGWILFSPSVNPLVKPRPPSATSIPAILKALQDEWVGTDVYRCGYCQARKSACFMHCYNIYCLMVLVLVTIMTIFNYKVRDDAKLFNCSWSLTLLSFKLW